MNEINGLKTWIKTTKVTDYKISSDEIEISQNENTKRFFYNQWKLKWKRPYLHTWWSCWLFGSMWVISDLTWYEFTTEDHLSIQKLAVDKYKLEVPWWMYMSDATDCLRTRWNKKFPDKQLMSFRTTIWSKIFAELLKKGHSLSVGYKTSMEYRNDSQDDWIVTWENFPKEWGHLVRTNYNNDAIKIDDNYFWTRKWNTYTNNKIKKLKDNWVFFKNAYYFLYKEPITNVIRNNIDLDAAKQMYDKWYWNGLNPRKPMSRQEVMTVLAKINNL